MSSNELTDKEAEIYDRQIRLWGVEAQRRLRAARVCLAGFNALAAEIAKNTILAGISVVIQDDKLVTLADSGSNFFLADSDLGQNRAAAALPRLREMNTLVTASATTASLSAISDEEWASFKLVVLCDSLPAESLRIAEKLHHLGVPVITSYMCGTWAACFVDFIKHDWTASGADASSERKSQIFPPLTAALSVPIDAIPARHKKQYLAWLAYVRATCSFSDLTLEQLRCEPVLEAALTNARTIAAASSGGVDKILDESIVRAFVAAQGVELAPVAAILGGIIGNEIVKLMTAKDEPIVNVFIFDGLGFGGGAAFRAVPA